MIYYDPTESRSGTRMSPEVREIGVRLDGLEPATGADILVTAWDGKLRGGMLGKPPGSILLRQALAKGMLVQRKSGLDMLGSIPHLGHIFQRMQIATEDGGMLWLAYTGRFEPNLLEHVECDGRDTEWHWNAFQGALDMWSIRGGMVHWEPNDERLGDWLLRWDERLPKLLDDPNMVLSPRPKSRLTGGTIDPSPWRRTLESFPGVGSVLSHRIAIKFNTLAEALWWMSTEDSSLIEGVGLKMKLAWRQWLGLEDRWIVTMIEEDDPYLERRGDGEA